MKNVLFKLFLLSGIFFPPQKSSSQNVLFDGNFSTTTSITPYYTDPPPLNMWLSWANFYGTGASFTTNVQDGVCSYFIDNPGTNMYDVQLTQYGFPLVLNHRYRLSLDVKADAERDFGVFIGEFQGLWTNLNPSHLRHATTNWQTITIDIDATAVFPLHKLSFEMGIQKINMHFANISLIDLGPLPVVIAGTFQHASGCSADWDPTCNFTALTYNASTGLWSGAFEIPAGCHQYKVTIGGSWAINYGENGILGGANISLYVPEETLITFTYDPSTHFVTTSPFPSGFSTSCLPQVVLTGSFQNELGCSNDWDANCSNSALIYVPATGQFENDFNIPPGFYEYRAVLNGDWVGNNFGDGGKPNGSNYFLFMPCAAKVHFSYNPITHIVTAAVGQPNTVVIAGSFQSEVGCTGDWQPDCNNSRMKFDPYSGSWVDTLHLPAGHWEYKVTINNSWDENYGLNGERNGPNIQLDLCAPAKVIFTYFHAECYNYNYVSAYAIADQPNTVVIAGSFQSEVGCTGDWQPDCNSTRMQFEPDGNGGDTLSIPGHWVDTLLIPAGHWEYKFTVNNSWNENYGLYGEPNGPNISLDLCYPAKVAFSFYYNNCNGYGDARIITNGVCVNKFYDGNVNGYPDAGEQPMGGVTFTLTGTGITQTQTTGDDGKAAFSNLPDGIYVVKEQAPSGYFAAVADSQFVYVFGGSAIVNFGNVCVGPGGAKGLGFWISKNGETVLKNAGKLESVLWQLREFSLRNADGNDFDPYTYAQLKEWMQKANAKNMLYMLSAQMAAMYLNLEMGYVSYSSYILTKGCSWANFTNTYSLIWSTHYYLLFNATGTDRSYAECLKTSFDNANNNLTFAQPSPCSGTITTALQRKPEELTNLVEAKVWPNPSNSYFTVTPGTKSGETFEIRVMDVNGRQVYTAVGSGNMNYRFGDKLIAGLYFVEIRQGTNRSTIKVVKQ